MCRVYVLRSLKNGKRYVGFTRGSVEERLKQHNSGSNRWTRRNRPLILLMVEEYRSPEEAQARERFLKTGAGREVIDQVIMGG